MKRLRRIATTFNVLGGAVIGVFVSRLQRGKIHGTTWVYVSLTIIFLGAAYLIERHRKRLEKHDS